jgi:hypothetical protein
MTKKRINRDNVAEHLVEYQLALINKTVEEANETPEWFSVWSMTEEQHEGFKAYALPLLKKVFKFNTNKAKSTFAWFDLCYGLRIQKKENDTK